MEADSPPGSVPAQWQPAPGRDEPPAGEAADHRLGFGAEGVVGLIPVPDDLTALLELIEGSDIPFNGAFVPLVVHLPTEAERSYDAAEWAADLIGSVGGRSLVLAPYAETGWTRVRSLSARQWNHAAAMVERLEVACRHFAVDLVVGETIGGEQIRPAGGLDPDRPVRHILDAGGFAAEGLEPVQLVSPLPVESQGGLIDRLRGLIRDRA